MAGGIERDWNGRQRHEKIEEERSETDHSRDDPQPPCKAAGLWEEFQFTLSQADCLLPALAENHPIAGEFLVLNFVAYISTALGSVN